MRSRTPRAVRGVFSRMRHLSYFCKKRRKRCKQDGYKAHKRSLCGIALREVKV